LAITLSINGKQESVEDGTTVAAWLAQRHIRPDVVTVEINRRIVEPTRYDATPLRAGDVVEFVYIMGGDRA
jgi:sulfur carrier protein